MDEQALLIRVVLRAVVSDHGERRYDLVLIGLARRRSSSRAACGRKPGPLQASLEGAVTAMEDAIEAVLPGRGAGLSVRGDALGSSSLVANLVGPCARPELAHLGSVGHGGAARFWCSCRCIGSGSAPRAAEATSGTICTPNPIMLPFHLISEVSRTVALAVRLFGNMMSLEIAAVLVLLVAGFLVPVPLLLLHIVEA